MPDAGLDVPLAALPATVDHVVRSLASAATELAHLSAAAVDAAASADLWVLRRMRFTWRIEATHDQTRTIVFFWKRTTGVQTVARADVSFVLAPTDPALFPGSTRGAVPTIHRVAPPIVVREGTPHEPQLPAFFDPEGAVLLRVGAEGTERLLVKNPEREGGLSHAEVAYFQGSTWRRIVRGGFFSGTWEPAPFLALHAAICAWLARDPTAEASEPYTFPPALPAKLVDPSTTRRFLRQIVDGYAQVTGGPIPVDLADSALPESLLAAIPVYAVRDFQATVKLRLDEQGQLTDADGQRPYGLEVALIESESRGQRMLRMIPTPPDFLVSGELHRAFLDALRDHVVSRDAAGSLGFASTSAWDAFLTAASPGATFFRVDRRLDTDVDVVVLRADWTLMIRVEARVDATVRPPTASVIEVESIYDDRVAGPMGDEAVGYFFRLIGALQSFASALA